MKIAAAFLFVFFIGISTAFAQIPYESVQRFDPARDPQADLQAAIQEAQNTNKRILLDVGGEWCIWCHRFDDFLDENTDIHDTMLKYYIVMKVNFSPENKNEAFLAKFPQIEGYPHIFILESNGNLLQSQNTGELESEKSYDKEKVMQFLLKWKK